jgi:hypothetical protein
MHRSLLMDRDSLQLLHDPDALAAHVTDVLLDQTRRADEQPPGDAGLVSSAVLFLLQDPPQCAPEEGPRLVLNERSRNVPQPGDLCCPGGGMDRWDPWLARGVDAPGMILRRWPYRPLLSPPARQALARLIATALREGFEEMRLLPRGVSFLGLLPSQRLRLLRRAIRPVVARLERPQHFRPNWEVAAIVSIPLRHLLDPSRYARYRVRFASEHVVSERLREDFLCYRVREGQVLWGATLRITTLFLERVFGFSVPPVQGLPLVEATLDATYLTGQRRPSR